MKRLNESLERIKKMRNGEKIKCPKCESGFISAVGEPREAYVFKCDGCRLGMILTKVHDI